MKTEHFFKFIQKSRQEPLDDSEKPCYNEILYFRVQHYAHFYKHSLPKPEAKINSLSEITDNPTACIK